MIRRSADLLKGLLAALAIVGLVVGVPLALSLAVGSPLPAGIPSGTAMREALTSRGIDDAMVVKTVAILIWLAWLQVAAAFTVEVAALVRRRPALSLPGAHSVQAGVARLVTATALIGSAFTGLRAAPAVAFPALAPVVATVSPSTPIAAQLHREAPSVRVTRIEPTSYEVRRHDSLWSIAERTLGDGLRWQEIRDLNIDVRQPDGGAVRPDTDLVRPGWNLLIPVAPATTGTPSLLAGPDEHRVERGEHLWEIAEDTLSTRLGRRGSDVEVDPYWREMIELNRDRLADPNDPSTVFAGQEILLPPFPPSPEVVDDSPVPLPAGPLLPTEVAPVPEASPVTADARPSSSATNAAIPSTTAPAPSTTVREQPAAAHRADRAEAAPDAEDDAVPVTAGLLGVAGTALAAGISLAVARRRRAQVIDSPVGSRLPALPADLDDLRTEVHLRADADAVSQLRTALAQVAAHVAAQPKDGRRRRPRLVQLSTDRIEVLLDEATLPAPEGWTPEASGAVWSRERPMAVGDAQTTVAALVSIGRPDSDTEVLFDLEAAGLTTITGADTTALDLLRSIVLELINSTLSDTVEIAIVNNTLDLEHERIRHVGSWDEIANDAVAWAQLSREALAAHRFDSAFAARGSGRLMDGLVPFIVVMSNPPADASFERFCDLALGGAAACAVVIAAEPSDRGTNLIIQDTTLRVPSLGLSCELQRVDERTEDDVQRLLIAADAPARPGTLFDELPPAVPPSNGAYDDPSWEVLVRVLGEMTVIGGHKPLTPKQLGLVTYLALHADASADRVEDAIWPDPMASRRRRLHNTVSQVRAALGPQHFPASEDSSYRAGPNVRTDLDLLKRRVAYASTQPAASAIVTLRGALELVDGPVFSYRNADRASFVWVDLEHWVADTEAKVVEVAWKLWHMCTEAGDHEGAIWAARQGLLASPANTELTDALMRAYLASGDRSSAEQVYESHVKALDQLDLDEVASTTLDLRDEMDLAARATT